MSGLFGHADWCRTLMTGLRDGGIWGVPRSMLTFQKKGDALVLTKRGPHLPHMIITAERFPAYQTEDYLAIKKQFEAAGIPVRDESLNS